MPESPSYQAVIKAIDELNQSDPNHDEYQGKNIPKELLYSQRMSACLDNFAPNSSENLKIAVRAQHIQRWKIPREDYESGRKGYLEWRVALGKFHAQTTADIMQQHQYSATDIERVKKLLTKKGIKRDEEVQTLEDVACLVFLQYYLGSFAPKYSESKLIDIIQKTWKKMSPEGQAGALQLPLEESLLGLVSKALAD